MTISSSSPAELTATMEHLASAGARALADLDPSDLERVWGETMAAFLDPHSEERLVLEEDLRSSTGLSPAGLQAGLEAVLGGVQGDAATELFAEARRQAPPADPGPVLVFLAGNLPALAVQPLLPALALGRPVLLKASSGEPHFPRALVAALHRREPRLQESVAAAVWPGGEVDFEAPLLARAGKVLVYGDAEAVASVGRRSPAPVVAYGPKVSLAIFGRDATPAVSAAGTARDVALGLARDVALFDQRGCLSVHAVYTAGDAVALAHHLAEALEVLARRWPPGPAAAEDLAAVQQVRADAKLRGLPCEELSPAAGTVVVDEDPTFRPSPGLRTVRIHPCYNLEALEPVLRPWTGRLQGAAVAGSAAEALTSVLEGLGVSRIAPPGELQSPDARWHNGGISPLEALG